MALLLSLILQLLSLGISSLRDKVSFEILINKLGLEEVWSQMVCDVILGMSWEILLDTKTYLLSIIKTVKLAEIFY